MSLKQLQTPNLFTYATGELSQDAFLCWMLEWADPKHSGSEMSPPAQAFLASVLEKFSNAPALSDITEIKAHKQDENIDVWAELRTKNKVYALLIEDKTGTVDHGNQLKKYKKDLEGRDSIDVVLPLYFKTIDSSHHKGADKTGYKVYLRKDFLACIEPYTGTTNNVLSDFIQHMKNEDLKEVYEGINAGDLEHEQWRGFLKDLQEKRPDGSWDYVPNESGGFMCFYEDLPILQSIKEEYESVENLYIQFNCSTGLLETRIHVKKDTPADKAKETRNKLSALITESKELSKPSRFGYGKTMSIAVKQIFDGTEKPSVDSLHEAIEAIKL